MCIINNTKKLLNNKLVKILFSLIIISIIMVGIYFGITSIIKYVTPKCQHDTIEINGKCYNPECSNSCSIDKQTRDLGNPPLCPCSCPEDTIVFKNPNTNKLECVNKCGKHGLCSDPLDPKSCVWVNYNINDSSSNDLKCFQTLDNYKICDTLPKGPDGHYVACDNNNHKCSQTEDSVTYCYNTSHPDPSSGSSEECPLGTVNPCSKDDDCKDIYTGNNSDVECIKTHVWSNDIIGYCDNSSTGEKQKNKHRVINSTTGCADKDRITKAADGDWKECSTNQNPCNKNITNCNGGCCINNVCNKSGACLKTGYGCTIDGTACPLERLYNCSDYENKKKCKGCCAKHSVNNKCLNLCDYKSDIGKSVLSCNSDKDCGNKEILKAYGAASDVGGVCVESKCYLACGDSTQSGGDYSCANFKDIDVSHCYKETNCQWGIPSASNPGFEALVPPDGGLTNKIICNRDGDGNNVFWRPEINQKKANYNRILRSDIRANKAIDQKTVCNIQDFQKYINDNPALQNFSSVTSVKYIPDKSAPYALITSNCRQLVEHENTEEFTDKYNSNDKNNKNNFNSITDFENLNKKSTKTNNIDIRWDSGKFPGPGYISPIWNTTGHYNNSSSNEHCVNPTGQNKVTPQKCKYLSNSKYCAFGSFDGINCISSDQENLQYKDLCAVTTYPNNMKCKMPYKSSSGKINRKYYCTPGNPTGFNSCCGMGGIITKACPTDGECPECSCTEGITKDTLGKCKISNNANFLGTTSRLQPCKVKGTPDGYCYGGDGHYAQIFKGWNSTANPTNLILLLKVKNSLPSQYLNLSSLHQNTPLKIVDGKSRLNIFLRTAMRKDWPSTVGNHFSCLAYYNNGYKKILQGVGNHSCCYHSGIVNDDNQNAKNKNIKPIVVAALGPNNEYVLWTPHVSQTNDDLDVDGNRGYCGDVNINNNRLEFNYEWDGTPGRQPSGITPFEIVLSLSCDGSDDHMIKKAGVYNTVKELFDAQFIHRSTNYTINDIIDMCSTYKSE